MGCTRASTGAAPPRSTSASTRSTACWSWDARSPSASPDPGRGRGRCARDPDPCNTVAWGPDYRLDSRTTLNIGYSGLPCSEGRAYELKLQDFQLRTQNIKKGHDLNAKLEEQNATKQQELNRPKRQERSISKRRGAKTRKAARAKRSEAAGAEDCEAVPLGSLNSSSLGLAKPSDVAAVLLRRDHALGGGHHPPARGAKRGRDRLLDRDHRQAAERQALGGHQNDLGRPSTCSAT